MCPVEVHLLRLVSNSLFFIFSILCYNRLKILI